MDLDTSSFGHAISSARKKLEMSQRELASKIRKEDGETISAQYLNDIERDRRSPSSDHIVKQFAKVLGISADVLYWLAGRVPGDLVRGKATARQIDTFFTAFREMLR